MLSFFGNLVLSGIKKGIQLFTQTKNKTKQKSSKQKYRPSAAFLCNWVSTLIFPQADYKAKFLNNIIPASDQNLSP